MSSQKDREKIIVKVVSEQRDRHREETLIDQIVPDKIDILDHFKDWNLDDESICYLNYHCERYVFLLKEIQNTITKLHRQPIKILDIGPSFQTIILQQIYPENIINTLGFEDSRFKIRKQGKHYQFDLNDAQYQEKWINIEEHDLIIMAEVIEHLYTSPVLVLKCISSFLKYGGHLVIQTPNACSLDKRLKMMTGKNPYEQIRENRRNPGHFREYTVDEFILIGKKAGLEPVRYTVSNYFNDDRKISKLCKLLSNIFPAKFREGMTICFEKRNPNLFNIDLGSKMVFGIDEAGFYTQEWHNGRAVRWTNGAAKLTVPLNEQSQPTRIRIDIEAHHPEGTELVIVVNEYELFNRRILQGGWAQTFRLPGWLRGNLMVIKLLSGTFVPRETMEESRDPRKLGVLVRSIRLLRDDCY